MSITITPNATKIPAPPPVHKVATMFFNKYDI